MALATVLVGATAVVVVWVTDTTVLVGVTAVAVTDRTVLVGVNAMVVASS